MTVNPKPRTMSLGEGEEGQGRKERGRKERCQPTAAVVTVLSVHAPYIAHSDYYTRVRTYVHTYNAFPLVLTRALG